MNDAQQRILFRPACMDDLNLISRIESAAHAYPWPDNTLSWAITHPSVQSCVMLHNETLSGYAFFECVLDEATLLNITIHPDYQQRGFGRRLLSEGISTLDAGIQRILLEVRVSNSAARTLYERAGFTELSCRKAYYPAEGGREDAIVMDYWRN